MGTFNRIDWLDAERRAGARGSGPFAPKFVFGIGNAADFNRTIGCVDRYRRDTMSDVNCILFGPDGSGQKSNGDCSDKMLDHITTTRELSIWHDGQRDGRWTPGNSPACRDGLMQ